MTSHGRIVAAAALLATGALLAACGGGSSPGTSPGRPAAASPRKPDASVTLTIVPSNELHGNHRVAASNGRSAMSKSRRPQFIDSSGSSISLQFNPYNVAPNNPPSAPSTFAGPIPIASSGPTVATVPVFGGGGFAYGVEIAAAFNGGQALPLASNANMNVFYQVDPGTNAPISMTLSLVPAHVFLVTSPTIPGGAFEANVACINVGNANLTQTFTLVPGDANYNYLASVPGSSSTPPPSGLSGIVTLSNITPTTDAGGTSTIVPTAATWNGYTVYQFVFTPTGNGDAIAPPVTATATTVNPDNGYDYLDNVPDPPGNNGDTYTETVTINPANNQCG